jgi:zinc transport system permease protein
MDDFLLRALAAGIGVALVAGPLGSFVVWRRMAYFGDTLAHSALLGVALGLLAGIDVTLGIILACTAVAVLLAALQRQRTLASDTLLGIMAHGSLALGLVVLSLLAAVRVDLLAYLFGDLLAVTMNDLCWIWGGGAFSLAVLALIWRPLLSLTVHEELARVEGAPVALAQFAQMLLIAVVIAVAMKIVGVLLITSLMIIPAATARRFSSSPEGMALAAAAIGCAAVAGGLAGSYAWDTPSGPSVVVCAALLFGLAHTGRRRRATTP